MRLSIDATRAQFEIEIMIPAKTLVSSVLLAFTALSLPSMGHAQLTGSVARQCGDDKKSVADPQCGDDKKSVSDPQCGDDKKTKS